jgi:hypothetical protein
MPSRKDSPNRNEAFGRLLSGAINSIATYEGRATLILEEELGQMLSLSGKTIQRYKAGHLPPEDRAVEILAEAAINRGYLGREWLQRFLHAARYVQLRLCACARHVCTTIYQRQPTASSSCAHRRLPRYEKASASNLPLP